jgi:hypothetical protein
MPQNLMADHPVPSQQANSLNHLPANTSSHTALHRMPSHVQHVACLAVSLIVVVYPCLLFF